MRRHHFLSLIRSHPLAAWGGAVLGLAIAVAWVNWAVNFAPFDDDASSSWSTADATSDDGRKPDAIYQPRVNELLRRVRVNGRFGGLAWQNLREATEAWLLADPVACLNRLIESNATGLISDSLLTQAIERAAKGNFAVALRMADEIGSASIRRRWVTLAFEQLARTEPESAFLALESVPPQMRWPLTFKLVERWGEKDGKNAFDAFLRQQPQFASMVASVWASKDPDAAFAFFVNAPHTMRLDAGQAVSSRVMLDSVMMRLSSSNPEKMLQFLNRVPENNRRAGYLSTAFYRLSEKSPQRALELVNSLPGDLERLQAKATIASAVMRNDPALAAKIRESLPGERTKSSAETSTLWNQGYEDPALAAEKVGGITDHIARSDALHSVATVWLSKKPAEFAEFATQQVNSGDCTWVRAMADTLVDWAEQTPNRPPSVSKLTERMSKEALEQLRMEISVQMNGPARESLLKALEQMP